MCSFSLGLRWERIYKCQVKLLIEFVAESLSMLTYALWESADELQSWRKGKRFKLCWTPLDAFTATYTRSTGIGCKTNRSSGHARDAESCVCFDIWKNGFVFPNRIKANHFITHGCGTNDVHNESKHTGRRVTSGARELNEAWDFCRGLLHHVHNTRAWEALLWVISGKSQNPFLVLHGIRGQGKTWIVEYAKMSEPLSRKNENAVGQLRHKFSTAQFTKKCTFRYSIPVK